LFRSKQVLRVKVLTWVGVGVDRLACCDVVAGVAVTVVEGSAVDDDFEVAPVVEVDEPGELEVVEPKDTPELKVDEPDATSVVVELSTGGVVIGEPLASVVVAMQYHSPAFRLSQSMPVFQAERLAAGTPIMESRSSQLLFCR
jgi:hypothetical protein